MATNWQEEHPNQCAMCDTQFSHQADPMQRPVCQDCWDTMWDTREND